MTYCMKSFPNIKDSHITFRENHDDESLTINQLIKVLRSTSKCDTVGHKGDNVFIPKVRISSSVKNILIEGFDEILTYENLKPVYGFEVDLNVANKLTSQLKNIEFSAHLYLKDGHFAVHKDGVKSTHHLGTILIFPPGNFTGGFTGGNLILYPEAKNANDLSGTKIILEPASFHHWTMVAFTIDMYHQCEPITSGERMVLKTELEINNPIIGLPERFNILPKFQSVDMTDDTNVQKYHNKIRVLEKKIRDYQDLIAKILACEITPKIDKLMHKIRESKGDVLLLLKSQIVIPDQLIGEERLLWNTIISQWPYSEIIEIEGTTTKYADGETEFNIHDVDETFLCAENPLFWKKPKKCGCITNEDMEYNDNTYYKVTSHEMSAILVHKNPLYNY